MKQCRPSSPAVRPVEELVAPPGWVAGQRARRDGAPAVVDAGGMFAGLNGLNLPHPTGIGRLRTESGQPPVDLHHPPDGRGSIAEAAVDATLARGEDRYCYSILDEAAVLGCKHRAKPPTATVCRGHRDPGHSENGERATAGQGHGERE